MIRKLVLISLIIILILISWYLYENYFIIYTVNNQIDVNGVKVLQKLEDVRQITGEQGEDIERGVYQFSDFRIVIGRIGPLKGRVWHITSKDPKDSIYGVKVGDTYKTAIEKIKSAGFVYKDWGYFRGCVEMFVLGQDETITEVHIRAWDRLSITYFKKVNID